jgi:hypothetical protein
MAAVSSCDGLSLQAGPHCKQHGVTNYTSSGNLPGICGRVESQLCPACGELCEDVLTAVLLLT